MTMLEAPLDWGGSSREAVLPGTCVNVLALNRPTVRPSGTPRSWHRDSVLLNEKFGCLSSYVRSSISDESKSEKETTWA